jgi:hypothetical protein
MLEEIQHGLLWVVQHPEEYNDALGLAGFFRAQELIADIVQCGLAVELWWA